MEKDLFRYKSHCELAIISNEINLDLITEELHIVPDRFFRKGDQSISKHSGSIITKPHNLWAIKSKSSVTEEESINHHIKYLKTILFPKINILKKYKEDPNFEISFWIWIETDNAGIGLDLNEDDIWLLNISNRVHFSLISKKTIESE